MIARVCLHVHTLFSPSITFFFCPGPYESSCKPFSTPQNAIVSRKGYGTTPVGCRGGSRHVEGCWGLPHLKIKKNGRLLFFDYRYSFVAMFAFCLVSWFQKSIKFPFHAFRKISISRSSFSRCYLTYLHSFSARVLSESVKQLDFRSFEI